jgi:hypothetical protein
VSYLKRMVELVEARACMSSCGTLLQPCYAPLGHPLILATSRWFSKLAGMDDGRLARQAWLADIDMLLQRCERC